MNPNMEPIEDISTSYSNVKECVSINCVGEVLESMDKTLSDSHIKKEYEKMKPHEKRMFNQWVRFHHEYQQKHGVAGMSRQLMNLQVTTQCPLMDPVIPAIEMATAEASVSQVEIVDKRGVRCIVPVKIKEEPDHVYAVTTMVPEDAQGLPDVLEEAFEAMVPKEYESYDEEDVTDCSFISDDEIIETDEEHLAEMEDKDIKTVDVEAIQVNITTITQGLHMAADGYEQLNEKLSMVPPEHVISLVEQVPLPSLEPTHPGITTALKQDGHHHILQLLV